MMISIITPSHKFTYIKELYETIIRQSHKEWEWIIVVNGDALVTEYNYTLPEEIRNNQQVKIFEYSGVKNIGALKRFACSKAIGDIIVEVDHDDMLFNNALDEVQKAFDEHPDVCFVYSNCARIDNEYHPYRWDASSGWKYRDVNFNGHIISEVISPEPLPQNITRIYFAPDHLRAWRTSDYWKIGGHNSEMKVADDHDLICRFYLHGKIFHINKCLYVYRIYGQNSWLENYDAVQSTQWGNYERYVWPIIEKWADDKCLQKIDLCGGIDKAKGYISYDRYDADLIGNLDENWKLTDNSVAIIRAHDAIEHLKNPIHTMNEAWRVLAHGGFFMIQVPSTEGLGAFSDPTHCSFWNIRSFRHYTEESMRRYLRNCKCRFQIMRLRNIIKWDDKIPYVEAHLIAIKEDDPRFHGLLRI